MKRIALAAALLGAFICVFVGAVTPAHAGTLNSRAQAVRKANEYLQFESFSLKGLVSQLKFEGFSTSDATYGASHAGANWWKQAAKKAREYLKMEAFSRSGLVGQLEFEGFTPAQALYGARAVGL
jgi:host cell surface-exposed lipoprotein